MTIHPAALTALIGTAVLALLPSVLPPYYVGLMIPFFGYAIALLGFNLLFGYTGLLSFGHAMFLGLGAYGAAVMSGVFGVKSFELVLVAVMFGSALVALPIAFLCARYVGIFFGMLTLAFGMLFYSFLFKFYHLTGGDSGMRVPRMNILGLTFERYNKIEFLAGPFYYYCLGLLIIAGFMMWRIVHSPFGLHVKTIRDNARKAEYLGVHVHRFRLAAFVISAAFGAVGGAILAFRVGLADPELVLLDPVRSARLHGRSGRLLKFLWTNHRRANLHFAAGPTAIPDPILAVHARRYSGSYRYWISGGYRRTGS